MSDFYVQRDIGSLSEEKRAVAIALIFVKCFLDKH